MGAGTHPIDLPAGTMPAPEVLWRPGCPYCSSLRRGLRRAGIATIEHDIWASPDAAARVRAATGGDETVPTVIVGTRALVNPSVSQVIQAMTAEYPGLEAPALTNPTPHRRFAAPGGAGPSWTAAVAALWLGLTTWQPGTTWHLAPALLAAAWPWVTGRQQSPGEPGVRRRILTAGLGGLTVTVLTTLALAAAGRLDGATVTGAGSPTLEALVLAGCGSLVATGVGLVRTRAAERAP